MFYRQALLTYGGKYRTTKKGEQNLRVTLKPKGKRARCDCSWEASVRVKSNDPGPVVHELAAGSLNVDNPNNFWNSL
jgi:hypothetical protein